jgi:predicted transcriptional regulator
MDPECRKISKEILPAVRASIAQTMFSEHNYCQREIGDKLGVVQVSVSKYINKKYSKEIGEIVGYIESNRLNRKIVQSIISGEPKEEIVSEIDKLCSEIIGSSYYKEL